MSKRRSRARGGKPPEAETRGGKRPAHSDKPPEAETPGEKPAARGAKPSRVEPPTSRRPGGAQPPAAGKQRPAAGARPPATGDGHPAGRRSVPSGLLVQLGILVGVFAATVLIAELAGAANLGVALGIGQVVFGIALLYLLLTR